MKKNLALIFFSLIISFLILYSLVLTWVSTFEKYRDKNNFTSIENLNFHEKYSNQLHHLRGNNWLNEKREATWKKEDYLFTVFEQYKDEKQNFLIQGDSWAEYMVFKNEINKGLSNIVKKKGIGLINSGISSYSPSPMKVQYKILEDDYGIKPDYLISIIDQTDIGDELCRYKHNIINNEDNTVKHIKREFNTGAVMDASKHYSFSRILLEKENFINFHVTNYYFFKTFNELKNRIYNIKKNGFKNSGNYKCEFQQIQKYLFKLDEEEKKYFKKRTMEYLNFLEQKKYLKKIFIVTFPHENHLKNVYKINVSNLINELNLTSKFQHIDFNELIRDKNFESENIYEKNDPASHLNEKASVLYLEKIFEIIREKNLL